MHHRVIERDVRARLNTAIIVSVIGDHLSPRVDHNQLCPVLARLLKEGRSDRMVGRRIRSSQQRRAGILNIAVGRRYGSAPDRFHKSRHARGVTQTRAVIDVIRAEACAN